MIQAKAYAAQSPETDLAPWSFERREPGEHDVRFDILYCGVCHSDLHQIKNDWFPGIFPMVPGHEIVGKVAEVGSHVKKYKVGESVILPFLAKVLCFLTLVTVMPWRRSVALTKESPAARISPLITLPFLSLPSQI